MFSETHPIKLKIKLLVTLRNYDLDIINRFRVLLKQKDLLLKRMPNPTFSVGYTDTQLVGNFPGVVYEISGCNTPVLDVIDLLGSLSGELHCFMFFYGDIVLTESRRTALLALKQQYAPLTELLLLTTSLILIPAVK
jgi:hypothetical protein